MPIVQQGSINASALTVPNLTVQIVPPSTLTLNGVPTDILGVVGTASWGAVGVPTIVSSNATYAQLFGPVMARKYDMGTQVATAVQQGASNFRCVRVTDATDVAASAVIQTSCLTVTSLFTGSFANTDTVTLSAGTKLGTTKISIVRVNALAEVYDNIAGSGPAWVASTVYKVGQVASNGVNAYTVTAAGTSASSGGPTGTTGSITDGSVTWAFLGTNNAFWVAAALALNTGNSALRGKSQLVTATAGAGTAGPIYAAAGSVTATLAGGSDGVTTLTASVLVGTDGTVTRTGMYALRGQGCSVGLLADSDDSTQWVNQAAFGQSEGIYMMLCGPSGDTIANSVPSKQSAGLDYYSAKIMFGDWLYWSDQTNNQQRLVSPLGFIAGRIANLSPEQSSLNKQIVGVIGSQKAGGLASAQSQTYSQAELGALFGAGLDVICNPQPGGYYWGARKGHNSSSDATRSGDNYTRMTNYIAATLAGGMGLYVGRPINTALLLDITSTLTSFLQNLVNLKLLQPVPINAQGQVNASPFSVNCSASNNPFSQTSIGIVIADVQVTYQAILEQFIVNMQGGQTVVTTASNGNAMFQGAGSGLSVS
jgi:hypothetical protein